MFKAPLNKLKGAFLLNFRSSEKANSFAEKRIIIFTLWKQY
jgi:hypothetical protein